ncbi:MAG: M42 family peptidase, partial [Chloroflexota bacterium]
SFFKKLVETTGPSGYEASAQAVWRERVGSSAESIKTDTLGNSIAALNPSGQPSVMIEAHIDEIGIIVKYIDDNGYIYFDPIGGLDPATLAGNRLRIMGTQGPVDGVIGRAPIHVLKEEERKKMPELRNMWIDIGATDKADAEKLVTAGDAGGRSAGLQRLQGNIVTSNSLDDRIGSYIIAEAFRSVAQRKPAAAVFAASATQEEIGLRGARVASFEINPLIGIAVDVTWTSDHPHASASELGDIRVGKGPVLARGANTNPKVLRRLVDAARAEGVAYQIEADPRGTGTDENVMQLNRSGMATGLISVATRYLHTSSEVASLDDIDGAVRLLARFVIDVQQGIDLIP